tara:strand:+ start:9617 stop:10213 length:597 start_codon:yes stop_codon:yes gene_type:complete
VNVLIRELEIGEKDLLNMNSNPGTANNKKIGGQRLVFRLWYYFRTGWATYFTFAFAAINTLTVTYFLAVENYPVIHQIFPSFSSYVVTLVTIGVPLLVLVGYVHWKKSGARKAEVDIGFETDPFRRRTLVNSELLVMMNLKLLKMLVKLSEKKTLTEDELNSIKELDEELSNMTSERSFRNKIDLDFLKERDRISADK